MIYMNSAVAEDLVPLYLLGRGQTAEIGELIGRPEQVQHLHELGLRSGTLVEMLQPGTTCIVRLGDQRLCFRHSDALGVLVRSPNQSAKAAAG
jgi:Fe2+ transport system protein FeoA